MNEFNAAILSRFRNEGYSFILYDNMNHFAFIVPLKEVCKTNRDSCITHITDDQLAAIASGINKFSIYVLS